MLDWLAQAPAEFGLAGLFASAFLSATLLPGNSELALALWLAARPDTVWSALLAATLGNTLGSLTTYALGWRLARAAPDLLDQRLTPRAIVWLKRHGPACLLLAWLPVVGDGLCFAAGYLGVGWPSAMLAILLGKGLRYLLIALPWL